jgi:hypothetical protein
MDFEGSLPCTQQPDTGSYTDPYASSTFFHNLAPYDPF